MSERSSNTTKIETSGYVLNPAYKNESERSSNTTKIETQHYRPSIKRLNCQKEVLTQQRLKHHN